MSTEDAGSRSNSAKKPRAGYVPVFRPGRPVANQPVTLDQRTGREIFVGATAIAPFNPTRVWDSITELRPPAGLLNRNGLFPEASKEPAVRTFDILRTRILQAMASKKWTRLAVTSPTHGCGKSFVAANLALSLARLPSCRTVLLDLELRNPHLAQIFGHADASPLIEFLMGEQPLESHFRRLGRNLALGLNGEPVPLASELIQDPEFGKALSALRDMLQPDVIVMDTPPALVSDDVMSLSAEIDAVLLVVDGTRTSPEDIRACEALLEGRIPLLGVVLNRSQDRSLERYSYGQRG